MRTALFVLLACACFTVAEPARADDAKAEAAGRALFDEGVALMNANRFPEACPKLEASLDKFPGIGTRGKLAECYEKAGRLASAWVTYKDVARLAAASGDATREKVASDRATAIEPKLAYLTVVAPSVEIPGLVVKRNGRTIERLGAPAPVDAGLVVVEASAPGRKAFTTQVLAASGQTSNVDLPPLEAAQPAKAAPTTSAGTTATADYDANAVRTSESTWQKPVGFVMGGAGLVALVAGGFVGLSAKSSYDDAFDTGRCDRATLACDAEGQKTTEDARTTATTATILAGTGGALLLGGVLLYLTAPRARPPSAIRVTPSVAPGHAGIIVGGAL